MDELGFEPIEDDLGFEELGFEPEAPQTDAPAEPEMGWGEYIGRGVADSLPVVGAAAGGMAGTALGPLGTVGGGALGYAGGAEARDLVKGYFMGDELPSASPEESIPRAAGNLAKGAMYEMGGQALGPAVDKVASGIGSGFNKTAGYLAEKAAKIKDARPGTGQVLLDKGVVRPMSSASGIASRAANEASKVGADKEALLSTIKGRFSVRRLTDQIDELIASAPRTASPYVKRLEKIKSDLLERGGGMSAAELDLEKQTLAGLVNWQRKSSLPLTTRANKEAAGVLREGVNRAAEGAGMGAELSSLNSTFGALKSAANPKVPGFKENILDATLGVGGAAADIATGGTGAGGLALAGLRRFGTTPALSTSAAAANTASKMFSSISPTVTKTAMGMGAASQVDLTFPEAQKIKLQGTPYERMLSEAAERGPEAAKTLQYLLSTKDPEYQKLMKDEN